MYCRRERGAGPAYASAPPFPPDHDARQHALVGVRSLSVTCELCHHGAVLPADDWSDAVLVRDFRHRMVCSICGIVGADARPNWREMQAAGNWRRGPVVIT
jgi:hypothetical protein